MDANLPSTSSKYHGAKRGRKSVPEQEKLKKRVKLTTDRSKQRVYIGQEITRWREMKESLGLTKDSALAKFLIDEYQKTLEITSLEETVVPSDISPKVSTPVHHMHCESSEIQSDSIEVSSCYEEEDDDYEPSLLFQAVLPAEVVSASEEVTYEELGFGLEEDNNTVDECNVEDVVEKCKSGVRRVKTAEECQIFESAAWCLVFHDQLIELAKLVSVTCETCSGLATVKDCFVGSALYIRWICEEGHECFVWCSQPLLNKKLHSGDFLACATILTSGNNYGKMALFAKMLNLKFPSADQFHRIQGTYIVPTVEKFWQDHQTSIVQEIKGQDLVILGDGRNDSPGHSAQYCSYTVMENTTKRILTLNVVDKRQTDRKSTNMEKLGFQQSIEELLKELSITEIVTDGHTGITALMKSQYPNIKHSYDIWHVAKNLGKRLAKVAQKKNNSVLLKWIRDIVNHFWFACKEAQNYEQFIGIWRGVLHHITNVHEWIMDHGSGTNKCLHEPLTVEERDKPWLDPIVDSQVIKDLANVVLDARLLKKASYFLTFRSTADLEAFQQHILMYCAKRFAYTPPVYRARNLLAAIDHNMHYNRQPLLNKDGSQRLCRIYNKKSQRWSAYQVKEPKTYSYIPMLLQMALITRVKDTVGMRKKKDLAPEDPRRLSRHLAPQEPAPTGQLMAENISRF